MMTIDKFRAFAALHVPGDPVILYNAWDVGSARSVARAGARAIATGSLSVADAQGFADGEALPMEDALRLATRIAGAVHLPVTIDFEGGYAISPADIAANITRLVATGVIGCNVEDQIVGGAALYDIAAQSERLAAVRAAAGAHFFINARTDLFLKAPADKHDAALVDEAIERGKAYAAAGASGFFPAGLADLAQIERLCAAVPLPVNLIPLPGGPDVCALAAAGIARISYGPRPYRNAMAAVEAAAQQAFAWR